MLNRLKLCVLRNAIKRPGALYNLVKTRFFLPAIQRKLAISATPTMLDIEPTAKCNLRCKYCQVSHWDRSPKVANLTYDNFVIIVDQFPHLLLIKLQGMGEPFLNADVFRMVAYAASKGIVVYTVSNGTLVRGALVAKIVASELAELIISVDGATKATFESIRCGAKFDQVVENVRQLVQLRNAKGNGRKPLITLWMVGTKDNIHECPQLVRLGKTLGVDCVYLGLGNVNCWGQDKYQELQQYSLDRADTVSGYSREVESILREAQRVAREISMPTTVYTCTGRNKLGPGAKCKWPWTSAYLSADGFVVPCGAIANPEVMHFGNVFEEHFADIWNSPKYQAFRQSFLDGNWPEMCNGCYV